MGEKECELINGREREGEGKRVERGNGKQKRAKELVETEVEVVDKKVEDAEERKLQFLSTPGSFLHFVSDFLLPYLP